MSNENFPVLSGVQKIPSTENAKSFYQVICDKVFCGSDDPCLVALLGLLGGGGSLVGGRENICMCLVCGTGFICGRWGIITISYD